MNMDIIYSYLHTNSIWIPLICPRISPVITGPKDLTPHRHLAPGLAFPSRAGVSSAWSEVQKLDSSWVFLLRMICGLINLD